MDSPHLDQFDSGSLFDLFHSSPSDLRLDLDGLPSFLSSDDARIDAVNDNAANSVSLPGTWERKEFGACGIAVSMLIWARLAATLVARRFIGDLDACDQAESLTLFLFADLSDLLAQRALRGQRAAETASTSLPAGVEPNGGRYVELRSISMLPVVP
jgi:hypothetical protein